MRKVEKEDQTLSLEDNAEPKYAEMEIADKVLAVAARIDALPYSVYVISQAGPKWQRKEVISYLKKNSGEYFEGRDAQKDCDVIQRKAEELAELLEKRWLEATITEDLPCFDFEINLNDTD